MDQFQAYNINPNLKKALLEMGIEQATPIQQKTFKPIMAGKDICAIAQTGTGKTIAYLLPCLNQLQFSKEGIVQVLIIVPTRELVKQVWKTTKQLLMYSPVRCIGVYGGVNMKPQKAALEQGCEVLIGTPGRLMDLALNGDVNLRTIKKFVIDEMDELLNLGFLAQFKQLLSLIAAKRQNLLFSATLSTSVQEVLDEYFDQLHYLEAASSGTPLENITQTHYYCPNFNTKVNLLSHFISLKEAHDKYLIFCSSKRSAEKILEALEQKGLQDIGIIHSNKEQNFRFRMVAQFENGSLPILIATDLVARGIDIKNVTTVFNFDLPEEPENYIHRIGRTGRAQKKGAAISFILEADTPYVEQLEELMKMKVPLKELPEAVEISTELTDDEIPKKFVPNIVLKPIKNENSGAAFHEKKEKNKKVNIVISHKEKMLAKYGKPKKRKPKK